MSTDRSDPLTPFPSEDEGNEGDEFPVDTSAMADMFGSGALAEPSLAGPPAADTPTASEEPPAPEMEVLGVDPVATPVAPVAREIETSPAEAWHIYGHDGAVDMLRRAIATDHLAHSYLFSGPGGVGKETLANRLAATLLAPAPWDATAPDLESRIARQIEAGECPDVERIAIAGLCDESGHDHEKDNSTIIRICQVRRMERLAALTPFTSSRRVFIIDRADDLQIQAAHALLKTLEEPPGDATLIMLARDPDALLPTIRSRCQEIVLRPMRQAALADALVAYGGIEPDTAPVLARLAHGRYGLAMTLHADPSFAVLRASAIEEMQELVDAGRNLRFDVAERLGRTWYQERESVLTTIDLWRDWWRDVLLAASGTDPEPPEEVASVAAACTPAEAVRALLAVQTAREHLLANTNAQLALEVMMLDLPVLERREGRVPLRAG